MRRSHNLVKVLTIGLVAGCGADLELHTISTGFAVSPSELQFGYTSVDQAVTRSLRLENFDAAPVSLRLELDEAGGPFSLSEPSPIELGPRASVVVSVLFLPTEPGARFATVTVTPEAGAEPAVRVSLGGYAWDPTVELSPVPSRGAADAGHGDTGEGRGAGPAPLPPSPVYRSTCRPRIVARAPASPAAPERSRDWMRYRDHGVFDFESLWGHSGSTDGSWLVLARYDGDWLGYTTPYILDLRSSAELDPRTVLPPLQAGNDGSWSFPSKGQVSISTDGERRLLVRGPNWDPAWELYLHRRGAPAATPLLADPGGEHPHGLPKTSSLFPRLTGDGRVVVMLQLIPSEPRVDFIDVETGDLESHILERFDEGGRWHYAGPMWTSHDGSVTVVARGRNEQLGVCNIEDARELYVLHRREGRTQRVPRPDWLPRRGLDHYFCPSYEGALSSDGQILVVDFDYNGESPAGFVDGVPFGTYAYDLEAERWEPVSVDTRGRVQRALNRAPSMSAEARLVGFSGPGGLITPDRPRSGGEVYQSFARDREAGVILHLSRGPSGAPADGWAGPPVLSADGRRAFFLSSATNLDPGDYRGEHTNVYALELGTPSCALVPD